MKDLNVMLVFLFLEGCAGDSYTNVTETGCINFDGLSNIGLSVGIKKDGIGVFDAICKPNANNFMSAYNNFTNRIHYCTVNKSQGTLSFCIDNTRIYDGGIYIFGSNTLEEERLYVLDKPTKPILSMQRDGIINVQKGELSCLSCSTSLPQGLNLIYSWTVNSSGINNSSKYQFDDSFKSTLIIDVEYNDKFNYYRCFATEQRGQISDASDPVKIDPKRLPTMAISPAISQYNVIENTTNLELTCNVTDSYPPVTTYEWYKDGNGISSNAKYTIANVQRSNRGNYTCGGTNIAGSSNSSSAIQLNVLYGIDFNPIRKRQPKEGTVLNITCSGKSNPAITDNDVTWTRQNYEGFTQKGRHLVIDNVNRTHSGTYICSVMIRLSPTFDQAVIVTGTTIVKVDVIYLPSVEISLERNPYYVVENTTNFSLTCNATDANPAVTSYKWYKDGSQISSTAEYTIAKVQRSAKGSYICGATNQVGSSNSSSVLQLIVLYGIELNPIDKSQPLEGTGLNITCSGKSYPVMTDNDISWTKKSEEGLITKGRYLVINNIQRIQSGTYVCSVVIQLMPSFGQSVNLTGTTYVEVDVIYRPTVRVSSNFDPNFVTENTTNLQMICNVTGANPAASSYHWNKNGFNISTAATYNISKVTRSHSGSYTCNAANQVGISDAAPVFKLNILYGVSLKLSETEIHVNESESLHLSCIGNGNPMPTIIFLNEYNGSVVGEQNANVTSINVDKANCMDTGLYTCFGNNSIGESVSTSAYIRVACKPRTYNNLEKQDIFINGTDESLDISTTIISFPLSNMSWSRQLPNGNLIELDSQFNTSIVTSQSPYEQIFLLQKDRLKQNEFGIYLVKASNIHGSFILTYNVISKRAPDPPTNITAICGITSIRVSWISRFYGGENQTFRISFVNDKSNQTTYKDDIADKGQDKTINEEKDSLSQDTLFRIFLEAYNLYGRTKSTEMVNCTTETNQVKNQPVSSALVGGITGSISALLIVVVIIGVLYFWRRRQANGGDKNLIKRHSKETDEDEEGLKTNPLYVTSGEVSNAEVGPVYGVINKKRQKKENMTLDENIDDGPVYSPVLKPTTQAKKNGKGKKVKKTSRNENYNDIELGTVHENSEDKVSKLNTSDELYANTGEPGKGVNLAKGYIPKKNKNGLIYADLDLVPGPKGGKFVIRGIENKTNYAVIDLSIKVDPLPSDDDEDDKDIENAKSAANESNE